MDSSECYKVYHDLTAAGAPLLNILAHVLTSQTDSSKPAQDACNLLATSKAVQSALKGCKGLLPVEVSPRTAQDAAGFAAWLAKHGDLISTLDVDLYSLRDPDDAEVPTTHSLEQDAAAEIAIAAALQAAAAAAAAGGLHVASCRLRGMGQGSAAILQALPAGTLTMLDLGVSLPAATPAEKAMAVVSSIGAQLSKLQQLRHLQVHEYDHDCFDDIEDDDRQQGVLVSALGCLTNLTRLELSEVIDGVLQGLPPSLVHMDLTLPWDRSWGFQLGNLTAVTMLRIDDASCLNAVDVLPPNLLRLRAGNLTAAACLLPLRQLQELLLTAQQTDVASAAELAQLSCLTQLTTVQMWYTACAAELNAAAGGWGALQLRTLCVTVVDKGTLSRSTLLRLSQLTELSRLELRDCTLGIAGGELAGAVVKAANLEVLTFSYTCWGEQQEQPAEDAAVSLNASAAANKANAAAAAAGSSPLEAFLQGLAAGMPCRCSRMFDEPRTWLRSLTIANQPVERQEAAAIGKLSCLRRLKRDNCQLDDCCVIDIVLQLKHCLEWLDVGANPAVTDASLLVLDHCMCDMPLSRAPYCVSCTGVTEEGRQQYVRRSKLY